ncbi:cytochrome P450 [Rhizophagus irregularis]|uniref:Cytochrome P450 n=2 Tax=Rhizophagus irregularis TaxID=588596 RepID=A0A2I1GZN7_9GLOM|nr:cytochrome P450 [Rhizophagus irregularis]
MITSTIISSFEISNILSLLIVFLIIYVTRFYYQYYTRPNPLPGPFPLPIIGSAYQQIGYDGVDDWLLSLHKKYGDMFEIILGGERMITLCRPDLTENLYVASSKTKYPIRLHSKDGIVEYGFEVGVGVVFNSDIKSWKYNRQFFSQAMMTPSFNHQAIEWTIELWNEMESYWNNLGENHEFDLIIWMRRFTNEMIFKIATGTKNDAIASYYKMLINDNSKSLNEKESKKSEESKKLIESLEIYLSGIFHFFAYDNFSRNYIPYIRGKSKKLLKNKDYLFDKLCTLIKEKRVEIENTPLDQPLRNDMLTSFITANTPRDINTIKHADVDLLRPMTDKEITGNILEAMLGGTDTTANFFCFVAYYLGHYPEIKQRLIQEFDRVLGNDLTRPITNKDLNELEYCDAVTNEIYRHSPIAYLIGRVSFQSDKVGGYDWKEGTTFQMLASAALKHKDYWTEPEKFDPDRFYRVEESDKYLLEKKKLRNTFPMFGGGTRMCPGRKLAIIELKCLLILIYRKYDIELVDMNAPLKYSSDFINCCTELKVRIKPRKF